MTRLGLLLALVAAAVAAIALATRRAPAMVIDRSAWVATAQQYGPVGYRDPAGAISPDGRWIAYSEGRFLRVRPVGGGPITDLPPGDAQIRNITWSPDSQRLIADGFRTPTGWAVYDRVAGTRHGLWADRDPLTARLGDTGTATTTARVSDLRQLAWSPAGRIIAAIVNAREGQELWMLVADGSSASARKIPQRIAFPAWTPRGELACVATSEGRSRVTIPCGGRAVTTDPDLDVHGPIAFAPESETMYVALANSHGTVDLWAAPTAGGRARQLTAYERDTYAPTVTRAGALLFKVQSYRTVVALASAEGGPTRHLATFQSETPSWDPTGRWLGITYGTWRRVPDDARYPDIAQEAGIIGADPSTPSEKPSTVVHASASEDQALCWSPNGKWIAFHSHKDQSDDIWLRPSEGDTPPRRISFLGRGAEAGWPRWSPDGKWLLFDGASRGARQSVMFVIGMDQESGAVTSEAREVPVRGVEQEVSHAEWVGNDRVAAIGKEGPGRHVIFTVPREGGDARVVHRFASEHDAPGLAVSPSGRDVAFIAPAPEGFFQVFRMPLAGGTPAAVTTDPSHKTQPAWSPDGRQIAFTVWNYDAQFWRIQ